MGDCGHDALESRENIAVCGTMVAVLSGGLIAGFLLVWVSRISLAKFAVLC